MTKPPAFSLSDEVEEGVPEGFRRLLGTRGYLEQLGPVYFRKTDTGAAVLAVRVAEKHLNFQGIAHGGMLTTLADAALGVNISLARGRRASQVTVALTADFLSSARPGDWLEGHATISRIGRTLAYASCDLRVGARQVLRSSAVFALHDRPMAAAGAEPGLSDG